MAKVIAFLCYLTALTTTGWWLLESSLTECRRCEGDMDCMDDVQWQNDAVAQVLQCSSAVAGVY